MNYTKILLVAGLVCLYHITLAQNLTGIVTDTEGSPLPGANIITQNGHGTATDMYGRYQLDLSEGVNIITVSYIGYESHTEEISTEDQRIRKDFSLNEGEVSLNDIMITSKDINAAQSISDYDLKLRPVQNSQEILRLVQGLFIAQHAGGGKAEQIFLRGFDIDHGTDINIKVDGLPVNMVSHAHGQGYSDLHFVIPETIKQIEFDKGPYDATYGNFATAGQVEFRTINNLKENSIKLEGGQYGTVRNVNLIKLLDQKNEDVRHHAFVASELLFSNGYFESPQDLKRYNLIGKYVGQYADNSILSVTASTFGSSWNASGQIPLRAVESGLIDRFGAIDDTEGGVTSRTNVNVRLNKQISSQHNLEQHLYYSKYDFNLVSNFTFFLNNPTYGDQITQSESRDMFGYGTTLESTVNRSMKSTAGFGFRHDIVDNNRLSSTYQKSLILEDHAYGDIKESNLYAFAQLSTDISKKFNITSALRYDYFRFNYNDHLTGINSTQMKGIASPKISVNYQINSRIGLFAKAGTGFHSNDSRVVANNESEDILPRARAFDIGGAFKAANNLTLNITMWQLNLDQEFVYVGDEGIVEPSGKTERKGIELSMRYQAFKWLHLNGDFNITDPKSLEAEEGQNYIPLAPTVTSTGGVNFDFNKFKGGVSYRFLGDRAANEDKSVIADGYFLLDAKAQYTQGRLTLGLSAVNLLNQEWREAQFETESRLADENDSITEIHFTPGSPFATQGSITISF